LALATATVALLARPRMTCSTSEVEPNVDTKLLMLAPSRNLSYIRFRVEVCIFFFLRL
jgi:hypothetical protein